MNNENKIKYVEALGNLMGGIKKSYAGWGSDIDSLDEPSKSIRLKMIDEFNRKSIIKLFHTFFPSSPFSITDFNIFQ